MASTTNSGYDYIIVSAGPAGLQMAYFPDKVKRRYIVLEAADKPAAFFEKHPRHRTLLSINKMCILSEPRWLPETSDLRPRLFTAFATT